MVDFFLIFLLSLQCWVLGHPTLLIYYKISYDKIWKKSENCYQKYQDFFTPTPSSKWQILFNVFLLFSFRAIYKSACRIWKWSELPRLVLSRRIPRDKIVIRAFWMFFFRQWKSNAIKKCESRRKNRKTGLWLHCKSGIKFIMTVWKTMKNFNRILFCLLHKILSNRIKRTEIL